MKCFGKNGGGKLGTMMCIHRNAYVSSKFLFILYFAITPIGLGDTNNRGDESGEMGDDLPYVDLGSGFTVSQIACGNWHTCALSTNHTVKCWGANSGGRLGL